jgi:hypothetical protein
MHPKAIKTRSKRVFAEPQTTEVQGQRKQLPIVMQVWHQMKSLCHLHLYHMAAKLKKLATLVATHMLQLKASLTVMFLTLIILALIA